MTRLRDVEILRKKRDIARAHEMREGSIAVLARRFGASSKTVRDAIAHDEAYWQAEIEAGLTGTMPARKYVYAWIDMRRTTTAAGGVAHELSSQTIGQGITIEGPIDAALNEIAGRGWEIVQVITGTGAEPMAVLVKRPRT